MSVTLAYLGAALLGLATLPQAMRLLRTRRAADFGWAFTLMNATGLALLTVRSIEIGEWAFVAINALTAGFWTLAAAVKLASEGRAEQALAGTG